jgi:two-component system chemotaxis response regulator CheB
MPDGRGRKKRKVVRSRYDVIAVGASAGGLFAVSEVLRRLPPDLPACVVIVQHLSPHHKSNLSELLSHVTALPVKEASDGAQISAGVVFVAPPDEHLLVRDGTLRLQHSEAVRFLRPSIDLLFESVAKEYGNRAIALVLSGAVRDGSRGIGFVKAAGGLILAEDPADAEFPSMPLAAVATGSVDRVLPLIEIGPALIKLCSGEILGNGR